MSTTRRCVGREGLVSQTHKESLENLLGGEGFARTYCMCLKENEFVETVGTESAYNS